MVKAAWVTASAFLVLAGGWFAAMENLLRHPGYSARAGVALLVALYGLLGILCSRRQADTVLRGTVLLGSVCGLALGAWVAYTSLQATHFEGYLLLTAAGLVVQTVLTVVSTTVCCHSHTA
jgi:hypothetical protein